MQVLSSFFVSCFNPYNNSEEGTIIIPTLKMRKLSVWDFKQFTEV